MSKSNKKNIRIAAFIALILAMHLAHHWWLNRKWEKDWIDAPQAQSYLVGRDLFTAWDSLQTIHNKEDEAILTETRQFSEETLDQAAQNLIELCRKNPKIGNRWVASNLAYAWQYHQQYERAYVPPPGVDIKKLDAEIQEFLLSYLKANPADDQFIMEIAGDELRYQKDAALLLEANQAKPGQGAEPSSAEKKRVKAIQYVQRYAKNTR